MVSIRPITPAEYKNNKFAVLNEQIYGYKHGIRPFVLQTMQVEDKAAVEKRDYLNEKAGIVIDKENTYFNIKLEDDIEIEEGKTYLCTIWSMDDPDMLFLGSFAFDCREVDEATLDTEDIMILNNETEEWEALSDFLSAIQQ